MKTYFCGCLFFARQNRQISNLQSDDFTSDHRLFYFILVLTLQLIKYSYCCFTASHIPYKRKSLDILLSATFLGYNHVTALY